MTTVSFVTGSTIADAASQANVDIASTDYVSDLTLTADIPSGQGAGSTILIGYVKNNGHFAGFRGHDKVKVVGGDALTAALLMVDLQPSDTNMTIVGMDTGVVGSDATGSVLYVGATLERNYNQ